MESMDLFSIRDLAHWEAWGDILLICKHKYYLPDGGTCFVFCDLTGAIDGVVFNVIKRVFVDVFWTL